MFLQSLKLLVAITLIPFVFMAGAAQAAPTNTEKAPIVTKSGEVKSLLLAKGQNQLPKRDNKDSMCS